MFVQLICKFPDRGCDSRIAAFVDRNFRVSVDLRCHVNHIGQLFRHHDVKRGFDYRHLIAI
jgi:hypothetical protein